MDLCEAFPRRWVRLEEHLTTTVLSEFEPLFDASCRKNVIGEPQQSDWLAKDLGFTSMGPGRSEVYYWIKQPFDMSFKFT